MRGLTTRGRSFFAAGLTAVFCAVLLGQTALLSIGLLLAALPLVSAAMLTRTRYRVASGRRLSPSRAPAGQEARVHLRVDNVSRVPTGLLLLEDKVPYVLGPRPRFVLDRVEPHGHREVSYRVRSDLRGRYPLGPLQLRLGDPFGMCELTRAFTSSDTLTVVPQVQSLPPVKLSGEWTGYGESHSRAVALAAEPQHLLGPQQPLALGQLHRRQGVQQQPGRLCGGPAEAAAAGAGDGVPGVGEQPHPVAALQQVQADRGGGADGPLEGGGGAVAPVPGGAAVQQHGRAAAQRLLLAPHHQLPVLGGGAPVHPAQVVAVPVLARHHVVLAGQGDGAGVAVAVAGPLAAEPDRRQRLDLGDDGEGVGGA